MFTSEYYNVDSIVHTTLFLQEIIQKFTFRSIDLQYNALKSGIWLVSAPAGKCLNYVVWTQITTSSD